MMSTSPEHWSRAYFRLGSNCDSVDNNICEAFNHSIMEARFYPVISMCEAIRKKLMVRIQENRARADRWSGHICPNIFKKLKMNIQLSGRCNVLWNGEDGFEVQEREDRKYIVNLKKGECTCRYWQLAGLPCCHAIAAIYKSSQKLDDYIAPCFTKAAYMKTYQHVLMPVEGAANWPISDMPRPLPPAYVKMPGRPKTQRRREQGEEPKGTKLSRVGIKMRCSSCGKTGHNTRKCPKNKEAGSKKNAHIRREKTKKRKMAETSSGTTRKRVSTTTSSLCTKHLLNFCLMMGTQMVQVKLPGSIPSASQSIPSQARGSQAPPSASQPTPSQSRGSQAPPTASQPTQNQPRQSSGSQPSRQETARPSSTRAPSSRARAPSARAREAGEGSSQGQDRLGWLLFGNK